MLTHKPCSECQAVKPLSEFPLGPASSRCTPCEFPGVKTYRNTSFKTWLRLARDAFRRLNFEEPSVEDALAAYEMGDSPETFASYVVNS